MSASFWRLSEQVDPYESRSRELLDEEPVEAAIAGDDNAFYDLVSRHRRTAVRVASGIVGPNRAEDVVQEALLLAYKTLPSIRDRSKFSRWLATVTRFRALRFGRNERRNVSLDETLLETLSDLACAPRESEPGDDRYTQTNTELPKPDTVNAATRAQSPGRDSGEESLRPRGGAGRTRLAGSDGSRRRFSLQPGG